MSELNFVEWNGRTPANQQDSAVPWVEYDPKWWAKIAYTEWVEFSGGHPFLTEQILHEWFKAAFDRGAVNHTLGVDPSLTKEGEYNENGYIP